jgi:hypothetical protein
MSESTVTVLAGPKRADGSPVFTGKPPAKVDALAEDREAWERQPHESTPAFEAFREYRGMGATRSTRKVAQRLSKSDTLIRGWSSRWHWRVRIEAWEREQDRLAQRQLLQEHVRVTGQRLRTAGRGIDKSAKRILSEEELTVGQAIAALDAFRKLSDVAGGNGKTPALVNSIENAVIAVAQEKVDAREITD